MGSGAVAVVQGLPDSGLAVTLLSRRLPDRHSPVLDSILGVESPSRPYQNAVDARTETMFEQTTPRDTGYRSSYQMTHCISPTSPVRLPPYSNPAYQHLRSYSSRSHDEEVFVESLRKYPSVSPNRSQSADLIQRMLKYTQYKNSTKNSKTRSAKSLPSKEASNLTQLDHIPTRDNGISIDDVRSKYGYKRDVELIPAPTNNRKSSSKGVGARIPRIFEATNSPQQYQRSCDQPHMGQSFRLRRDTETGKYDYLKSGKKEKKLKGHEVRYLTNVKQCLKERLREICNEEATTTCPNIQRRYDRHRRQYHGLEVSQKENRSSISKHHKACYCDRPTPCDCATKRGSIAKSRVSADNIESEMASNEVSHTQLAERASLEREVLEWFQEVPVYASFSANDKFKSEQVIQQLIKTLDELQKDNMFMEKAEDEIKKCLNILPMWHPENKEDQEMFHNKLVCSLLKRLKRFDGNNGFEEVISQWVDGIPFSRDVVDKGKIVDDFKNKLKIIASRHPLKNEEYKETLKSEVINMLQELPIEAKHSKSTIIDDLADKLVEKLVALPTDRRSLSRGDIEEQVLDWVKYIPQFSDDNNENNLLITNLITRLTNLPLKNTGSLEQANAEIMNWLNSIEEQKKCHIDIQTKKSLTDRLIEKLFGSNQSNKKLPTEKIDGVVKKWFSENSENLDASLFDSKKYLEMLTSKLQSIVNYDNDQNIMREEILNWLRKFENKQGKLIDSEIKENLVNKLISMITDESNKTINKLDDKSKYSDSLKDVVSKEVAKILDNLKGLSENVKERLIDRISKVLAKDWDNIHSLQTEIPLSEITDILEQDTNLSKKEIEKIAQDLIYTVKESTLPGFADTAQSTILKDKLRDKVVGIFKGLPVQNNRELINTVTDILSNKTGVNDNSFKEIYDALIKANVRKYEATDITNKLLNMIDQVRSELNESESVSQQKQMFMQRLEHEITDFMENVYNETASFNTVDNSTNPYNKFKKPLIKTSTPRSSKNYDSPLKLEKDKSKQSRTSSEIHYKQQIKDKIKEWINSLEFKGIIDEPYKDDMANDIATDFIDRQMYIQLSKTKTSSQEEMEHLKYQVFKWTNKLPNFSNLTIDSIKIRELLKLLKDVPNLSRGTQMQLGGTNKKVSSDSSTENSTKNQEMRREATSDLDKKNKIKKAVQTWCQKLPLKDGVAYNDIKETVDKIADTISQYLLGTNISNLDELLNEITTYLKQLPLQCEGESMKNLPRLTKNLIGTLNGILNDSKDYTIFEDKSSVTKPVYKKAAEVMYDCIQDWCENLPIDLDENVESAEKANMIKQNLAAKLLKKVGELNLDPEIFNDDFVYRDVLKDEIENFLDEMQESTNLKNISSSLIENLIEKILNAKEGMKTEIAAFTYKQQLRDAISKTLSSIGLPVTEETSFEVLRDNLADAFISLHYVADDEELKRKYKDKICTAVNRFCNEYLKKYPSSPLNAEQLNRELYDALKKVPMPKDETMRREVEQIKMKDVITDWFKELPISDTLSHAQENKMISFFAKRLQEIEKETDLEPNTDEILQNEISKWLKKFKFRSGDVNTDELVKNLVNKLKSTKDSRKLDETVTRKSITYMDLTSGLEDVNRFQSRSDSKPSNARKFKVPPSGLNAEDKELLQQIKDRRALDQTTIKPGAQKTPNNQERISQNASIQTIIRDGPITPQVIVKEYYWDTTPSPTLQHSGSILSVVTSPVTQGQSIRKQAKAASQETLQVTSASQTQPSPSIAKGTQAESYKNELETRVLGPDNIETSTQTSCLARLLQRQKQGIVTSTPMANENLSSPMGKGPVDRSCQPCRWRREMPGNVSVNTEAGPSGYEDNARQDMTEVVDEGRNAERPESFTKGQVSEDKCYWDSPDSTCPQPCFRRRICQIPTEHIDVCKRRRKSQERKNHPQTKCTIRSFQSPCHQSHKSCNAFIRHCPKCWDGFCPHPSYLYFKRD